MEPFNLTLSPVNSADNDSFDSFNNVVNYETNFGPSDQSLPLSSYNINTVEYTWTDYTYTTSSPIQTTQGGTPVKRTSSPVFPYQPVWCELHEPGTPPHRSYLVHHDDSLEAQSGKTQPRDSASVTKEQLSVLAQISSNTTAVAKTSRRQRHLVAKTVTSPSTPIPMASQQVGAQSSINDHSVGSVDDLAEGGDDNSFETVAEALRLQWSVIGNKNVAPVDPDIVARVVAEATGKIRTGNSTPHHPSPISATPLASSTPNSLELSLPRETDLPPSTTEKLLPANLIRIIPTEISTERANQKSPSWFSSGSKGGSTESAKASTSGNASSPVAATKVAAPPAASTDSIGKVMVERQMDDSNSSAASLAANNQGASYSVHSVSPVVDFNGSSSSIARANSVNPDVLETVNEDVEPSLSNGAEGAKYRDTPLVTVGLPLSNYQLESEEFLKSLPPIKPINLDAYAAAPLLPPPQPKSTEKSRKATARNQAKIAVAEALSSAVPQASVPSKERQPTDQSVSIVSEPSKTLASLQQTAARAESSAKETETSAVYQKQIEEILKEKAKLMGQVEILTQESQNVLQERAELQAQLASLKAKLSSVDDATDRTSSEASLRKEVANLRDSRKLLEQTVLDANRVLAEKVEEIRSLQDELQLAQDASIKLQVKTQEMRDEMRTRDMNVQALKNKIAELYVEVQTSIQAKMEADDEARTARNDLASLLKSKEWYQEQLQAAHDVRTKLQRELMLLQGQGISHGAIVEKLKTESARLRQQLAESQQRALRDKEMLAKHLERIQGDMMEREAAFLEIQRERKLYEDTFNSQVVSAEEEKSRMVGLQQATSDLEAQLQRAQGEATKRHDQLIQMETGQVDVMKRLALAEKDLGEKDKTLEEMEQKLIQVESQLQAVMSDLTKKDTEILTLKEEKASTEIALKSALLEKSSVDKALDILKADMGKVELSFKQMKQELSVREAELEQAKLDREKLQETMDCCQHELEIKTRSIDSMTRTFDGQSAAQHDMATERDALKEQVDVLRIKVQNLEYDLRQRDEELADRTNDIEQQATRVKELETQLESVQSNVPTEKVEQYTVEIENLRGKIQSLEEANAREGESVEAHREQMRKEVEQLQGQLVERQKAYDENLSAADRKMKELMSDRQQLETELGLARRSQELSQLEEREAYAEEIQSLSRDFGSLKQEKSELQQRLESVQRDKAAEISDLLHRLQAQNEALEQLQSQHALYQQTQEANQNLQLELEKERGRVMGLSQMSSELKDHSRQLETALAQRESSLEELRRSVQESQADLTQRDEAFLQRIAELEAAVEREVSVQKDLRKQMGTKIIENKRLKKQCDSTGAELDQLRQDIVTSQQTAAQAVADLDQLQQLHLQVKGQDQEEAQRRRELEAQVEAVTARLEESLAKEPLLVEQIQSLEWQHGQVSRELEAAREHYKQVEERAQVDAHASHAALQDKQAEVDRLQAEMSALRQEQMHQRSQVNQLSGTLQASVQHYKLTQRLNSAESNDVGVQAETGRKVVIPPLPFDLAAVEQLLRDTRVKPLESRPLDQLSDCLSSLRAEITGLQKQMDQHTSVVNSSTQSWKTVQSGVNDLNEVMKTIASTIIAANSTHTATMAAAADREQMEIFNV